MIANHVVANVLDVRKVEPKHRFEAIIGAWHRLSRGDVLDLRVDHDPRCMYYTLKAEYDDETFSFDYLEKGPESWRVLVTKHGRHGDSAVPYKASAQNARTKARTSTRAPGCVIEASVLTDAGV